MEESALGPRTKLGAHPPSPLGCGARECMLGSTSHSISERGGGAPVDIGIYSLPIVLVAVSCRSRADWRAAVLVLGAIYPLVLIVCLASPGPSLPGAQMSPDLAPYAMGCVHIVALIVGLVVCRGELYRHRPAIVVSCVLTALGMGASLTVHGFGGPSPLFRLMVLLVQMANLFLVFPALARRDGPAFLVGYAKAVSSMAIGIGLIGLYGWTVHGPFPDYYARLGRPLEARSMGAVLFCGFVCSALLSPGALNTTRTALLAAGVAATGTRSSLIPMALFLALQALRQRRFLQVLAIGAPATMVGVLLSRMPGLHYLARRTLTSGRVLRWAIALSDVLDNWVLGIGAPYRVPDPLIPGITHRPHNAIIESVASYGIVYAIGVYGLYVALLSAVWHAPAPRRGLALPRAVRLARWLVVAAMIESCVGTSMWTNLGDGFTISVVIFASIVSATADAPPQRRASHVTGRGMSSALPPAASSTVPTTR